VGRPNVGKSSLLNAFLGDERAVVSPIPGTTRDSVDSILERKGKRFLFVDTAGIRKSRHLKENVDHVSVVQARRSVERADVAILVLDTAEGLREMDAKVVGEAVEAGRGIIIAVNKWDLARSLNLTQRAFIQEVRDHLKFLAWAPVRFVSATSGKGLDDLLAEAERVETARNLRVTTGELNRMLAKATRHYAPKPEKGSGDVKILFATQIGIAPPTFVISINRPTDLHFSYRRYLENQLRESFGFEGTPIVLKVRARKH
jgi:GTP-binding protein